MTPKVGGAWRQFDFENALQSEVAGAIQDVIGRTCALRQEIGQSSKLGGGGRAILYWI